MVRHILLMIPFLSFNEAPKINFVNILSIKETVFDVTLVWSRYQRNVTMCQNLIVKC